MASSFPTSLDAFTNPSSADALDSVSVPHASQHSDLNDAVEALEAKVGVDGSAVVSSHDYKIAQLPAGIIDVASTTTDVNLTTSATDILDVSYTPTGTRRVVVVFYSPNNDSPSTAQTFVVDLRDTSGGGGTLLQQHVVGMSPPTHSAVSLMYYTTISAASTFYASAYVSTGTLRMNTGGDKPIQMYIVDLGEA